MCQSNTLYALDLHTVTCQIYLIKKNPRDFDSYSSAFDYVYKRINM